MLTKIGVLGVFSTAMVGMAPLPTWANTATVQNASQQATVTGDNNQVIQVISQVNVNHPGQGNLKRALNYTGTVQDAAQGAMITGQGNQAIQNTTQFNQHSQVINTPRGVPRGRVTIAQRLHWRITLLTSGECPRPLYDLLPNLKDLPQ
ncbi:hypothetical protein [Trichothermofontia sp.]